MHFDQFCTLSYNLSKRVLLCILTSCFVLSFKKNKKSFVHFDQLFCTLSFLKKRRNFCAFWPVVLYCFLKKKCLFDVWSIITHLHGCRSTVVVGAVLQPHVQGQQPGTDSRSNGAATHGRCYRYVHGVSHGQVHAWLIDCLLAAHIDHGGLVDAEVWVRCNTEWI